MTPPKRPNDINELANIIVAESTGAKEIVIPELKNQNAIRLGQKGGRARAERLTPEERSRIARKAAKSRQEN